MVHDPQHVFVCYIINDASSVEPWKGRVEEEEGLERERRRT